MKTLFNLMHLDFISIKNKSLPAFIVGIILVTTISIVLVPHAAAIMPFLAMGFMSPMSITAEKNGYNRLYGILPVSRKQVVYARFAEAFILCLVAALIGIAIGSISVALGLYSHLIPGLDKIVLVIDTFISEGLTPAYATSIFFLTACFSFAVLYFIDFIFGVEKEGPATLIIMFGLCLIIAFLILVVGIDFAEIINNFIESTSRTTMAIILYLLGMILIAISAVITSSIMNKREL